MDPSVIRVLLVEDSAGDARLIREMLSVTAGARFDVSWTERLTTAKEQLARGNVEVVLLDLSLPDGHGIESFLEINEVAPAVPVVILSGLDDEALAVQAVQQGAQDYLVKGEADVRLLERALRCAIERKAADKALAERIAGLDEANRKLTREIEERRQAEEALQAEKRLLMQSLALQERERKLIAYEIHDGLVQLLTGAEMKLQAALGRRDAVPAAAKQTLDQVLDLLRAAIVEARRLIRGLRPPALEEAGLVAAVDRLVRQASEAGGPRVELDWDLPVDRLPLPLQTAVFRIIQEALTNAQRHSGSDRVRIAAHQSGDRLQLEVRDWGVGFDPQRVEGQRFGLEGIRERVRLLGGQATVDAAPDRGTRLIVELPLPEGTEGQG